MLVGNVKAIEYLEDIEKYIDKLEKENKQLKSQLKYKQELIEKIKENVTDSAFEVNTKEYGKLEVVETNVIFETSIRWNK